MPLRRPVEVEPWKRVLGPRAPSQPSAACVLGSIQGGPWWNLNSPFCVHTCTHTHVCTHMQTHVHIYTYTHTLSSEMVPRGWTDPLCSHLLPTHPSRGPATSKKIRKKRRHSKGTRRGLKPTQLLISLWLWANRFVSLGLIFLIHKGGQ